MTIVKNHGRSLQHEVEEHQGGSHQGEDIGLYKDEHSDGGSYKDEEDNGNSGSLEDVEDNENSDDYNGHSKVVLSDNNIHKSQCKRDGDGSENHNGRENRTAMVVEDSIICGRRNEVEFIV